MSATVSRTTEMMIVFIDNSFWPDFDCEARNRLRNVSTSDLQRMRIDVIPLETISAVAGHIVQRISTE